MESSWPRADVIGAWTLLFTVAGAVAAWLAVPGFREWTYRAWHGSDPIDLGDLSNALPYDVPLAPGIVREDRKTLDVLLAATAECDWDWLRGYDFGGSFQWSTVAQIRIYAQQYTRPQDEFIDGELEKLRIAFNAAAIKFVDVADRNTVVIYRDGDWVARKVSSPYEDDNTDEEGFHRKAGEINEAADAAYKAYDTLIRRARLKLALGEPAEGAD